MRDRSPLPWLHIAEEVAAAAAGRGFRHVLVLGTRYLMESPVYPAKLGPRGIRHETPGPEDRARINALTLDELFHAHAKCHVRFVKTRVQIGSGRGLLVSRILRVKHGIVLLRDYGRMLGPLAAVAFRGIV